MRDIKISPEGEALEKKLIDAISELASKEYPLSILKKAANVSYRQINEWEAKGYISTTRDSTKKWRKFTFKEIFALQVANTLKGFGLRPSKLSWIISEISKGEHFEEALLLYFAGIRIYFYSDLFSIIKVGTCNEVIPLFQRAIAPTVLFYATILIDTLLTSMGGNPESINKELDGVANYTETDEDHDLLMSIKNRGYDQINIKKKGGKLNVKGVKYINKNIGNEIMAYKNSGKKLKITTHMDGVKFTNASIEETLE